MSDPLVLPITPADLSARISFHWPGEHGVARAAGVDPNRIGPRALPSGTIQLVQIEPFAPAERRGGEERVRAIRFLLDRLEDDGLAVDRERGAVMGWAAVRLHDPVGALLRIVDIDYADDAFGDVRHAHDSAVLSARLARRAGPAPDAKREGARGRWLAAYGKGGGR